MLVATVTGENLRFIRYFTSGKSCVHFTAASVSRCARDKNVRCQVGPAAALSGAPVSVPAGIQGLITRRQLSPVGPVYFYTATLLDAVLTDIENSCLSLLHVCAGSAARDAATSDSWINLISSCHIYRVGRKFRASLHRVHFILAPVGFVRDRLFGRRRKLLGAVRLERCRSQEARLEPIGTGRGRWGGGGGGCRIH